MPLIRLLIGIIIGTLVAANMFFIYTIFTETPKDKGFVEVARTLLHDEGREVRSKFDSIKALFVNSSSSPQPKRTADIGSTELPCLPDIEEGSLSTQKSNDIALVDSASIAPKTAESGNEKKSTTDLVLTPNEPVLQEHKIFGPFYSNDRAVLLAEYITKKADLDCYVVSMENGYFVTIRTTEKFESYIETIRKATGLDVPM